MLTALAHTCKTQPFVKITPAFAAGIVCQYYVPLSAAWLLVPAAALLTALAAFRFLPVAAHFHFGWIQGLLIGLLLLLLGCTAEYVADVRNKPGWIGYHYQPGDLLCVEITQPPAAKKQVYSAMARVLEVKFNGRWQPAEGQLLVYVQKDSSSARLNAGSRLLFAQPLQRITNSGNPGAFDYSRYCAYKNIYHQVYLAAGHYVRLPGAGISSLRRWLFAVQRQVVQLLQQRISDKTAQGLAEALLIGYRDDMDKDLLQTYSDTGLVHIIAISGLHLGMLYGLLMSCFAWLRRKTWQRLLRGVAILAVLWLFTLLAGAGASVMRSAMMFTFITLANMLRRNAGVYNNLGAAAFCLLLYDPFCLWDAGFQLSYGAVIGIVLFYQPVNNWFTVRHPLLKSVWQLMAISIAAQVLTLPLVLYYFHQFPLLFLVSNLVAVPLSGIILYAELLLLVVQWIGPLAWCCGKLLGWLISCMNWLVGQVSLLPFSNISQVNISVPQVFAWYLVLVSGAVALLYHRRCWLLAALAGCWVLLVWQQAGWWQLQGQNKLVVYNIARTAAAELVTGHNSRFIGDASLLADAGQQRYYLLPAHTSWQIEHTLFTRHWLYRCGHTTIGFLSPGLVQAGANTACPVDILVLSGSPVCAVAQLQQRFHCKQLVFDCSNPLWKIQKWKKDCDSLHLRFHSVPEQGAFITGL